MERDLAAAAARYESDHFAIIYPELTGRRYAVELAHVLEEERRRLTRWILPARSAPKVEVHLFPVESFLRNWGGDVGAVGIFDGAMKVPFADLRSLHPSLVAILSGLSEAQFVEVAYAEAAWAVHFLEARFGRQVFDRLLDSFAAGRDTERALAACCRMDSRTLDRAFQEWAAGPAPAVWPVELRRYDREMQVASLRGDHPAGAPQAPNIGFRKAQEPADAAAAMRRWHDHYKQSVGTMKRALGQVYELLHGADGARLGESCALLQRELDAVLSDPAALASPSVPAREGLTSAFRNFRAAAIACQGGAMATVHAEIEAAEHDLGAVARALEPFGLRP
jgi:hypothetical protein